MHGEWRRCVQEINPEAVCVAASNSYIEHATKQSNAVNKATNRTSCGHAGCVHSMLTSSSCSEFDNCGSALTVCSNHFNAAELLGSSQELACPPNSCRACRNGKDRH